MGAKNDANVSDDVRAIEALLCRFERAVAGGDPELLRSSLSEDVTAVFTGPRGPVRGIVGVAEIWTRHLGRWREVTLRREQAYVRIHGDVAWASFVWYGQGRDGADLYRVEGERWTMVMIWEEGSWRIAQMHSSLPFENWTSLRADGCGRG